MRIRIPLLLILFISLFSCKKSEDPIVPKPIVEEPVAEDVKNPELTVNGFTDVIETTTKVSISIVDESTVETKVIHDKEEIATSTEKQFDVSINPYGIPVGPTDFVVVSKDVNGNETSETFSVEIKHLLLTYEHGAHEVIENETIWLFFNRTDGSELAVVEAVVGLQKVYTDQIVSEDKVLYSSARRTIHNEVGIKRLFIQTYEVPLAETRSPRPWNEYVEPDNTVDVQLNGVPINNGLPRYFAMGPDYVTINYDGDASATNLAILHRANRPIYIRTNEWGSDPAFDGKKENYFYTKITPQEGTTTMSLELDALIHAENNNKLEIPAHDAGSFRFDRRGSENDQDHMNYKNHQIYNVDESTGNTFDYIDLPIVSGLGLYTNYVQYSRDEVSFYSRGSDTSLDIEMPNWTADLQVNDSVIELTANNQDANYYTVNLLKTEVAPDYSTNYRLSWSYGVNTEDNGVKIIPFLALPEAISDDMPGSFYQTTDDMEWTNVSARTYEKYNSYEEVVGAFAFNQDGMTGLDNVFLQVTFFNPDYSGKSAKQTSNNLDSTGQKNFQKYIGNEHMQSHFDAFSQY